MLDSSWAPLLLIQFHWLCVYVHTWVFIPRSTRDQQPHMVYVGQGDGVQAENLSENQGVGPQGIRKMQFN